MSKEPSSLEHLMELAMVLNQQNNFNEILRVVSEKVSDWIDSEIALIMMLNPNTQQTVKTIFKEGKDVGHPRFHAVHSQISGWILKYQEPLITPNIQKDPSWPNSEDRINASHEYIARFQLLF